jgi:phosphoribosylformylglycinamidine synthase
MNAQIFVTLKTGVLDPQGKAVHHALGALGFDEAQDVRQGKFIEMELADGTPKARIEEMCEKLLANTVIENYEVRILDGET